MAASSPNGVATHIVMKDGSERDAQVLEHREGEMHVHYSGADKRHDEWVSAGDVRPLKRRRTSARVAARASTDGERKSTSPPPALPSPPAPKILPKPRKVPPRCDPPPEPASVAAREPSSDSDIEIVYIGPKPGESSAPPSTATNGVNKAEEDATQQAMDAQPPPAAIPIPQPVADASGETDVKLAEEDLNISRRKQIKARRNFDKVNFGHWQIKTWYFSPYPLSESEPDSAPPDSDARVSGVTRATPRSHGRTSDLLAGGLGRDHAPEKGILWVCDRCFKYMAEGTVWEAHMRRCTRKNPPGKKVYQRGAHTIWEVDGAKEKLYCQNLSLFGKLFIDVKTLFFDCEGFLFYLLTDADSQRDHVLGFFSKEKVTYDNYNLACIIVLPPYQRQGYGMLMIEFSYELSRRAGRPGTPERPLSDLGLRSYLTYWASTILRYLRHMLSVMPSDIPSVLTVDTVPDFSLLRMSSSDAESSSTFARKRRKTKGWDGERHALFAAPLPPVDDSHTIQRTLETRANPDGSATTHAVIRCSLEEIARATNLRVEDAAFAMNECGLLSCHDGKQTVIVTREAVERIATERKLKRMCMQVEHVLLP